MRISDWSSDVCSSDLATDHEAQGIVGEQFRNTCTVVDVVTYRLIDEAVLYGRNVDRDGDDDADRNHCSQHELDESHGQVSPCIRIFGMRPERHCRATVDTVRSEEHTSELQSLMRISYAV